MGARGPPEEVVSLVSVELAEHLVCQRIHHLFIPVVNVSTGKHEADYISVFIAEQVLLEYDIPPHGALTLGGDVPERPHALLKYLHYSISLINAGSFTFIFTHCCIK